MIPAILVTLALILLSSVNFHRKAKRAKRAMKRLQPRDRKGRYSKLPLQIIHIRPRFRYVEERLMMRV